MRTSRLMSIIAASLLAAIPIGIVGAGSATAGESHDRTLDVLAWSRFDSPPTGTASIVVADARGDHIRQVTHPGVGEQDIDPRISPNGRYILFERDTADTSKAGIVGVDGRGERLIDLRCTDPCAGTNTPSWFPGGEHLLYDRVSGPFNSAGDAASANLWKSDLYGGHQSRFSDPALDPATEETVPSFAPAGYMTVIHGRPDGSTAVFRLRLDGTHAHQLTPWSLNADLPEVSPAESGPSRNLVVFETAGTATAGSRVGVVPATCGSIADCTASIRYLTPAVSQPYASFNPAWAPDGRHVIYVNFVGGSATTAPVGDIWVMRTDGSQKQPVSQDPRFEFRPAWGAIDD